MKAIKFWLLPTVCAIMCGCSDTPSFKQPYDGLIPVQHSSVSYGMLVPEFEFSYIDLNANEVLTSSDVTECSYFSDGLAAVYKGSGLNWGRNDCYYVNVKGDTVIRFSDYGAYRGTGFWENRAILERDNDYVIIDNTGKEIFKVDKAGGNSPVTMCYNGMILFETDKGVWRIYDADGNILHEETEYGCVPYYYSLPYREAICVMKEEGYRHRKYGAINVKGEVVIPLEYQEPICFDRNGYAVVTDQDGKVGLIDKKGKYMIEPGVYSMLEVDGDNLYKCRDVDGVTGWCDEKGKTSSKNLHFVSKSEYDFDENGYVKLPVLLKDDKYLAIKPYDSRKGILVLIDRVGNNLLEGKEYFMELSELKHYPLVRYYKYGFPYSVLFQGPVAGRVIAE